MKTMSLALLISLVTSSAHAVIADQFSCNFYLTTTSGQSAHQKLDFHLARVPTTFNPNPTPDIEFTKSIDIDPTIRLTTREGEYIANLTFIYYHALKFDLQSSHLIDARQHTCVVAAGTFCPKGPNNEIQMCGSAKAMCFSGSDPFHPTDGWPRVFFKGDKAEFDERAPLSSRGVIHEMVTGKPVGEVSVDCRFKGTIE